MTSEHPAAARTGHADAADPGRARAVGRLGLGQDLRRLRQARSLPLAEAAARLELAPSTLSRMETGKAPVKAAYLTVMLDLYDVHDQAQRGQLASLARDGMRKSWHDGYRHLLPDGASHYLDLESAATHLRSYSVHAVPGLAQTAGYAAAAIRAARPDLTGPQVRSLVTVQRRRQELTRSAGLGLHLVIDQSVFLRLIGTAEVMAGQLRHLLTLASNPAVTLRVVELARPLPALTTPFTILSFPGPAHLDVACRAGIGGQVTITTRRGDLRVLHRAFTALTSAAASPGDTASLIKKAVAHWERAGTP